MLEDNRLIGLIGGILSIYGYYRVAFWDLIWHYEISFK